MSGFPASPSLSRFFHSLWPPGSASPPSLSSVCPPHILMHFLETRSHLTVYCSFFSSSSLPFALGLLFSLFSCLRESPFFALAPPSPSQGMSLLRRVGFGTNHRG
ncbi:hypothetical protein TNIN_442021 [Trichonephila inaurata madagascariensis]|uniref:Uncharacterized protein n=1 Tax=Trichonephila inaurata madagascariensis TaxID=2747483 RepID=A0A8X7C0Q7_9ARAC|nr:hypothetical protein TNIN_442021 [Trichonephila inaurata madagascariensis]